MLKRNLSETNFVPSALADLPARWNLKRVGEILVDTQYGLNVPSSANGNIRIVGMKDIVDGFVCAADLASTTVARDERETYVLRPGDVLLNRTNSPDLVGKVGLWKDGPEAVFASYLVRLRPDFSKIDPWYLNYWLNSSLAQQALRRLATRAIGQANINPTAFRKYCPITVPPLAEQRRIAVVLRAWDDAIEHSRALIDAEEQEFAAFAASLLTGHRRFQGSSGAWTRRFLGDVTREVSARNGKRYGRERVKAVNKAEGMIPMKDHSIAGDLSRYRIVPPHGFAYNPMRLNIGSIAMNDHGGEILVSPDYVVFEALPGQLDHHFFNHFRRTSRWQRFMEIAGSGSVRVRIYYCDLAELPLHLPPIDEQRRIAKFLNLARREIDLRRAELAALEKQKRGIMQKLLTGEWRVPMRDSGVDRLAEVAGPAVAAGAG